MKEAERGQKVRDRYGKVHGVRGQIANQVYLDNGENIHRANCSLLDARGDSHDDWEINE